MAEYLEKLYEGITEVSPDEVMGAMLVGLSLSLACYGLCALGRKRAKDPLPLLCGLFFLISALSMAFGVGHSRYKLTRSFVPTGRAASNHVHGHGGPPGWPPGHHPIGRALLHQADADHDGRLTPDEAARFVRETDRTGKGWVSILEIDQARRDAAGPPITDIHPGPARPEETSRSPSTSPDQDSTGERGRPESGAGTRTADSRDD